MKMIKRALAAVLCAAVAVSVMSISAVSASAASDVFFAFSSGKKISQNGIKDISYTSNGIRVTSDDSKIQNCNGRLPESEKQYIEAVYNLSGSDTQAALATVQQDKTLYRISADINLHKVIGVKSMKNPNSAANEYTYLDWNRKRDKDGNYTDKNTVKNMGFGVETILIYSGKDSEGKTVEYKSVTTVSSVENPKKTLSTNLPKNMVSIDKLTVRFAQGSDWVTAVKSLDCEISNIKVTKLSKATNPIQDPKSDCVVDFTTACQVYQLGSARMAFSGMVNMTVDESSELYPNSAMSFYGKGYIGPDCFSHGWEDMGVGADVEMGRLKDYDGIEFYALSRKTDQWTVGFTVNVSVWLPNRDAKGNYLDKNGKKVSGIDKAYFFPWTFLINENKRPAMHAGTVMKFKFGFDEFESNTIDELSKVCDRLGAEIGEYYDDAIENKTLKLEDYKQYIRRIDIAKGLYAFTGKNIVVDYSFGDVYGCKRDKYGDLTSNMPAPAAYVDPNKDNVVNDKQIQAFIELYKELPKEESAYYNDPDGTLKTKLAKLLSLWGVMSDKTKKELELTYGYTEADYSKMALIYDSVYGEFDGPTDIDLDYEDDMTNPDSGSTLPIALAVAALGAGAVLVAVKRTRKEER